MRGFVEFYSKEKKFGRIIPESTKSPEERIKFFGNSLLHDDKNLKLEADDIVEYSIRVDRSGNAYANDVFIVGTKRTELTATELMFSERLMATNKYLATIQMKYPNDKDNRGYSNDNYLRGYRLFQMWQDDDCIKDRPLILRSVAALIRIHMEHQLGAKGNAPGEFKVTYGMLNTVIRGASLMEKSEAKSIYHRTDMIASKRAKPMSIITHEDNRGNVTGVVVASDNKSDLIGLVNSDKEIKQNGGVYCVYFGRDDAYKAVNFASARVDKFPNSKGFTNHLNELIKRYPTKHADMTPRMSPVPRIR